MSDENKIGQAADIDLADLSALGDTQQVLELRHPGTGEPLVHLDGRPYTITLLSKDSDKFVQITRQINDRRVQQITRTRQPTLSVMSEKDEIDLLVAATVTWDIKFGGSEETSKPTPENFRKAYKVRWIKEQVDEFVGNRGNFFKSS